MNILNPFALIWYSEIKVSIQELRLVYLCQLNPISQAVFLRWEQLGSRFMCTPC